MPVAVLLPNMQATRMQMALVIDEYGGTDGLVSLEDAVEMIVGEIEDESDEDAGPMIVPDGKGGFLANARADLGQVAAAIGEDFAKGESGEDVDTLGGLVFELIGRIPVRGELIAAPSGFEFEILDADPRRIKRLRIYRRPAAGERPAPPAAAAGSRLRAGALTRPSCAATPRALIRGASRGSAADTCRASPAPSSSCGAGGASRWRWPPARCRRWRSRPSICFRSCG